MSTTVIVRISGDPKREYEALRQNPELARELAEAFKRAGEIRHWRLVGDGEFLDIHEWESPEARARFWQESGHLLKQLGELTGDNKQIDATVWREPEPDEGFAF
jgi:hypothetical protein